MKLYLNKIIKLLFHIVKNITQFIIINKNKSERTIKTVYCKPKVTNKNL